MFNVFNTSGKVVYKNISMGFWGIEGDQGEKWLPTNLPEAYQKEGLNIVFTAMPNDEAMNMYMWGTTIDIISVTEV
jgi:hypothetical protein